MTRLNEQLANMPFPGERLADNEVISDVVVIAKVTRLTDGRVTVLVANNEGIDTVTATGLIECGRQLATRGDWTEADDDDE